MTSNITVHAPSLSMLEDHTLEIMTHQKQWLSAFLVNAKSITQDKSFPHANDSTVLEKTVR